jgi:hypothetical protein
MQPTDQTQSEESVEISSLLALNNRAKLQARERDNKALAEIMRQVKE